MYLSAVCVVALPSYQQILDSINGHVDFVVVLCYGGTVGPSGVLGGYCEALEFTDQFCAFFRFFNVIQV